MNNAAPANPSWLFLGFLMNLKNKVTTIYTKCIHNGTRFSAIKNEIVSFARR